MSQLNKLSSAYSDDGGPRERNRTDDLGSRHFVQRDSDVPDLGASVTANLSEHRHRLQDRLDDDADAIYERPDEDEQASGPPGSLSHQEIMSENIQSRLEIHKFSKPKQAQSVLPEQYSDEISQEVHASQAKKNEIEMPAAARVSTTIALQETSRSVQTFKMTYDRLFKKFQERLCAEYSGMRGGYMSEYQLNYDQNSSRRDDRLVEMNMAIDSQTNYTRDLERF